MFVGVGFFKLEFGQVPRRSAELYERSFGL